MEFVQENKKGQENKVNIANQCKTIRPSLRGGWIELLKIS